MNDLETGQDYPLFDGLSKDRQEAWAIFGVYTGFDWMPNGKEILSGEKVKSGAWIPKLKKPPKFHFK